MRTVSHLLAPLSFLYAFAARCRARRWRGRARPLSRPVLSVGNLTFGGTGKTPFVIHACEELLRRGLRPAVLSRGYRSRGPAGNDEAMLLRERLPEVPHLQNPDRQAAGRTLEGTVDCFVLDDGFQHLPLRRDVDIVLIDATDPFGGGYCPPAGRLREPLSALDRATLVVITRADLVSHDSLGETMREVRARTRAPVATGRFRTSCAEDLRGREVVLACGIGNPRAFRLTLQAAGARVAGERRFPDHHAYEPAEAAALAAQPLPVAVTEKDAVKLRPLWPAGGAPLLVVRIDFEPLDGAALLSAAFDRMVRA